jgi:hypothetical protein
MPQLWYRPLHAPVPPKHHCTTLCVRTAVRCVGLIQLYGASRGPVTKICGACFLKGGMELSPIPQVALCSGKLFYVWWTTR